MPNTKRLNMTTEVSKFIYAILYRLVGLPLKLHCYNRPLCFFCESRLNWFASNSYMQDVFGPSLGRVSMSRWKVKVTRDK